MFPLITRIFFRSRISKNSRRFYSSNSNFSPFDLDEVDDKYKELNNFYTDLFTQQDVQVSSTEHREVRNEIDEINEELNSIYNVNVLTASELENIVKSKGRFVLRSMATDPFYNLALEDYIFRNTPLNEGKMESERLLFYTNECCVVIGKNQNPWKELYLRDVSKRGYEFIRRFSGGGAVVHDLGNVNYSYLTSRNEFSREFFNRQLVKWLNCEHITLNDRGDLTYQGLKISGSAFKIAKGKSYHHGTMLVNSDLSQFKGLLKPKEFEGVSWDCNSVDSVRSDVTNIDGKVLGSIDEFCNIATDGFRSLMYDKDIPMYCCDETSILPEIEATSEKLRGSDWKYKSGPKFKLSAKQDCFEVEKGLIVRSSRKELIEKPFYEFYQELREDDVLYKYI